MPQRQAIAADFEKKADSYYERNYVIEDYSNVIRRQRRDKICSALSEIEECRVVLDLGCGPYPLFPELLHRCDSYFAVDLSTANLERIKSLSAKIQTVSADMDEFCWHPDYFDVIVASGSIEYSRDGIENISRICTSLKPGGTLICSFPNQLSPYRIWHQLVFLPVWRRIKGRDIPTYHRQLFRKSHVFAMARQNGFNSVKCHSIGFQFLPPPIDYLFPRIAYGAELVASKLSPILHPFTSEFIVVATSRD